ncbi:tyrosine-type recombinase/integrase [Weissella bombi]
MKDGERRRKTKSGFRTKSEAQGWANEMEVAKQNDELQLNSNMLFSDFFDEWFETFKKPTVSKSTARWYVYVSRNIHEYFKTTKIQNVTRYKYQKFLNDFGTKHGIATSRKLNAMIKEVARSAQYEGYITKNFAESAKITGHAKKDNQLKYLDETDMKALVEYIESKPLAVRAATDMMILFALQSGARYSEIAALQWDNLDFEESVVHIERSWDQVSKEFKPTKTKTSVRDIALPMLFMQELEDWHTLSASKSFVFTSHNMLPPTSNAANKQLRRDLDDISAEKVITFHGLRHTHASWLLSHNVDVQYVADRLGHSDISITLGTYTHLLKDHRNSEASKSVNLLSNL